MTNQDREQITRIMELFTQLNAANRQLAITFLATLTTGEDNPPSADDCQQIEQ